MGNLSRGPRDSSALHCVCMAHTHEIITFIYYSSSPVQSGPGGSSKQWINNTTTTAYISRILQEVVEYGPYQQPYNFLCTCIHDVPHVPFHITAG